jgi:MFS family permease
MLIPELPAYLNHLGGAEYKGLIIALFTLTAAISRPFSGKLTDTIGRIPVMAIGSVVCFLCGFLYPILTTVAGFLLVRLLHGFSTGFKPTATSAYVADLVPANQLGEAMGVHGVFFSTGMAVGPAIGSAITAHFSIDVLFYCSSAFALLSILILMNMKETLTDRLKFRASHLKLKKADLIEPQVMPAALITLWSYISFGVILTVISDWSQHLGTANKGLFFMVFTLASLLVRFVAGKVSDQYGRILMIKTSLAILLVSLLMIALATSSSFLMSAAAVYGIATGMLSPSVSAWTIDLSKPGHRGKAVATMYIFMEIGIGAGALLAGSMFITDVAVIPNIFYCCSGVTLIAWLYLQFGYRPKQA